jgi:O-antigen/teichoic acid export membrane protein
MTSLRRNIAANFAGSIWQAVMGLAFVPLYIRFMGVESYGLVGIFATLQGVLVVLDMGLSTTLNREMARLSVGPENAQEMRNLLRSLESIYWCVAIGIGMAVMSLSPFIAHDWVKAGQLSPHAIVNATRIMGLAVALQWPASLYTGGLMGLQRQVVLNAVIIATGTLRYGGAALVLWLISPSVQAFFWWQMIAALATTGALAVFLWRALPAGPRPVFQAQLIRRVWRFAAGMSAITILATILMQLDKIILSRMLTLEAFGYYTLAGLVGLSLYRLIGPVFSAVYPRFTQLVAAGDEQALKLLYHRSSQFMSVLILPATLVVAMFARELLLLWTRSASVAAQSHLLLSILICGTALNGLMTAPYALQLAHGWTRLALYTNAVAVVALVPMIVFMVRRYGAPGGAGVWVILNAGYVFIEIHFMHRRLLKSEKWRWYWQDVGVPLAASATVVGLARLLVREPMSDFMTVLTVALISGAALSAAALATPTTRGWLRDQLSRSRLRPPRPLSDPS